MTSPVWGGVTALLLRKLAKLLKVEEIPTPPPQSPAAPPDVTPGPTVPVPTTADGQLEWARQLIAEVIRDRDETKAELATARATVERLTARITDQDQTIAQLQALLGPLPPPRPPSPPR